MYLVDKKDNFITYGLTALSAIGYLLAKRGGYLASPFGIAFIANPFIALMHKREVDNYYVSDYTKYELYLIKFCPRTIARKISNFKIRLLYSFELSKLGNIEIKIAS